MSDSWENIAVIMTDFSGRMDLTGFSRSAESILDVPPGGPSDLDGTTLDRPRGLRFIWIIIERKGRSGLARTAPLFYVTQASAGSLRTERGA